MEENYIILPVDPDTFEYQEYSDTDESLIANQVVDTEFSGSSDYIEYYVYTPDATKLFPESNTVELQSYAVREGDVLLDPRRDLFDLGFIDGDYVILYQFYRNRLGSNLSFNYFINAISGDRTEIELRSNQIDSQRTIDSFNQFEQYREDSDTFVDFYLNFGNNQTVIANNMRLDAEQGEEVKIYIKLYEPLPEAFSLKDRLWVVEEISTPQAYSVEIPVEEVDISDEDSETIQGPNFNIDISQQVGQASEKVNYNQLLGTAQSSSLQQLKSLLQEKSINISVDYGNRSEFIKFSSAEERLKNFYFKASLIEKTENKLSSSIYNVSGSETGSIAYSSSKSSLESIIDSTIENFDGYEYFLYYNSGSQYSWPKTGSTIPYTLYSTGSTEVLNWYGSKVENNIYYGGQILSASNYDENNPEWLYRTIPEYLVEDPNNAQYEIFLDMIGQHFDNIWLYTKDITNRFNADNRLDYGISKDLVADAIKDFGVKLYGGNYDQNDLYESFLGIRADGDPFLVSNITGSVPVPSGSGLDYVKTQVTASDYTISLDDVQKSVYKRIYHNLPYLLKTKGTLQGLRSLISTFGIPTTILSPVEYSGAARRPSAQPSFARPIQFQSQQDIFNYYLDMSGTQYVETGFELNPRWNSYENRPQTVMFRMKPETILESSNGPTNASQKIFSLDTGTILTLDYSGSAGVSGSYDGSIPNPEYQFGQLSLNPDGITNGEASVYLPFFNGDWWAVQIEYHPRDGYVLRAGNYNQPGIFQRQPSYTDVGSIQITQSVSWERAGSANFGSPRDTAAFFSGGLQEIRYYKPVMPSSVFEEYIVNPESFVGSGVNSAPDDLVFRAPLGGELYTGSESVHPKISGSWQV